MKSRRDFATLYGWQTGRDVLILRGDRKPVLCVLPLALAIDILKAQK